MKKDDEKTVTLDHIKDHKKSMNAKKQGLQILFGDDWEKWNYLQSQLSYVTPCYISSKVAQLAHHYYGKTIQNTVLWDMFGGLGMDAINFSKFFNTVVTEIDPKVFLILKENIKTFTHIEDNYIKICAINEDSLVKLNDKSFMKKINVIFFDPPWGISFKTGEPFDFENITINNNANLQINILILLDKIYQKVPNIIIKSPILSDSFEKWALKKSINILQICEFPTHKLKYIFIGN